MNCLWAKSVGRPLCLEVGGVGESLGSPEQGLQDVLLCVLLVRSRKGGGVKRVSGGARRRINLTDVSCLIQTSSRLKFIQILLIF